MAVNVSISFHQTLREGVDSLINISFSDIELFFRRKKGGTAKRFPLRIKTTEARWHPGSPIVISQ